METTKLPDVIQMLEIQIHELHEMDKTATLIILGNEEYNSIKELGGFAYKIDEDGDKQCFYRGLPVFKLPRDRMMCVFGESTV